jgi:hypothetical protein
LLGSKLSLYLTNPTHSQSSNAIYDLANLFGSVFWPKLICFRHGTPSMCPDTSQYQAALLGCGRPVKIAHSGTWVRVATAGVAPAASAASAAWPLPRGVQCFTGPVSAVFFAARVTRQPQTTSAIRRARKSPNSRLSTMLFSAFGEGRLSQGRGDSHPLCIDNAVIDAAVPSAATDLDLCAHVPGPAHGHGFGCLISSDESFPVTTKSL